MQEIFKDVKNFENIYKISNLGTLVSVDRTQTLKTRWGTFTKRKIKGHPIIGSINNKGYRIVSLYKNKKEHHKLLHRLVAETFIPNPYNLPEVNHKDENKNNNVCSNLEWCTRAYNNNYGIQSKDGRRKTSKKRIKKVCQFDKNGNLINIFDGIRLAEEKTGIDNSNICACCKGKVKSAGGYIWKYHDKGVERL